MGFLRPADGPYLPERVELLPVGDGQLARLVFVDPVVKHFPLMQHAQGVRPVVVPVPDPARGHHASCSHPAGSSGLPDLGSEAQPLGPDRPNWQLGDPGSS